MQGALQCSAIRNARTYIRRARYAHARARRNLSRPASDDSQSMRCRTCRRATESRNRRLRAGPSDDRRDDGLRGNRKIADEAAVAAPSYGRSSFPWGLLCW